MKKRILNLFLTAVFVVSMLPGKLVFASGDKEVVLCNENGVNYVTKEEIPSNQVFTASSTEQLSKPQNLRWNETELGERAAGYVSWDVVDNCEGEYEIAVYCNGEEVFFTNWGGLYDKNGTGRIGVEFVADNIFCESGKFTFSVRAMGDGMNYRDSEVALSGEYNFVCPANKLSAPANLRWVEDGILVHSAVSGAEGYSYELYNQDKQPVGYTWSFGYFGDGDIEEDLSWYIKDVASWEENLSAIYIKVRALTGDIEAIQNSDLSAYSPVYDVEEGKATVNDTLDSIMSDIYDYGMSATEAVESLIDNMQADGISNTDFAVSMVQDENIVDAIKELESLYCEEVGTEVSVSNAAEDTGYLEERGIDVNKISVVGAALNSDAGKDVEINFSEGDKTLSQDELFYKNSIAVNIDIDGVKDSKKLDVPVEITMPLPAGVVADRLVILHYHADGAIETIRPKVINVSGDDYISFVLTSFSPFVFCNNVGYEAVLTNESVTDTNYSCNLQVSEVYAGKNLCAIIAFYDAENVLVQVKSVDYDYEDETVSIDYDKKEYSTYKFMVWENMAGQKPLIIERQ